MTSSRRRIAWPASISSETVRPSRIPSRMSAVMSATASGWLSLRPRARRRRATSAAVKIKSFSCSRAVRCIVGPPAGSDAQQRADRIDIERLPLALQGHDALVHDVKPVADRPRELEVLLDQQDRPVPLPLDPPQHVGDLVDDGGLDALGRLVEQEERRVGEQRPRDGELLLLAAGEVPAALAEHLAEPRKEREDVVQPRRRRALLPGAEHEVLVDGQRGEDVASLRDVADAEPGALVGRPTGNVPAAELDRSRARRQEAHDRLEKRRLPDAVAPHDAHHLAVADRQSDVRQDPALAVVDVDPVDGEHQAVPRTFPRPRYALITRSSACTRSSEPSESTVPSCSTVTRWPRRAICRTNSMSCSMSMTAQAERSTIASMSAPVRSFSGRVIPAAGSSSRRSLGSWTSSIAISSHCCSPCESVPARSPARSRSPTWSSTATIAPCGPISNRTRSSRSTMRLRFRSARNPSKDTVRFST